MFVDFLKAFDKVSHEEVINSLIRKVVHGKSLNLLIAMYNSLFTYVKVNNNKCNNKFKCNISTRQGCKLATILFILFLNDLIDDLNRAGLTGKQISTDDSEILVIFYAGDMASASDTGRGLQAQTEIISNFYERTGMEINLQK